MNLHPNRPIASPMVSFLLFLLVAAAPGFQSGMHFCHAFSSNRILTTTRSIPLQHRSTGKIGLPHFLPLYNRRDSANIPVASFGMPEDSPLINLRSSTTTSSLKKSNCHQPQNQHIHKQKQSLGMSTVVCPPIATRGQGRILPDIRTVAASPSRATHIFYQTIIKTMTNTNGDIWKGTRFHLLNGIVAAAIAIVISYRAGALYYSATISLPFPFVPFLVSHLAMAFGFIALACDNAILAAGKFIGPGPALRFLTKLRLVGHGASAPLFCIPIIQAATRHGLIARDAHGLVLSTLMLVASMVEGTRWFKYDVNKFQEVDNRHSHQLHSSRYLPGIFAYTSGKVMQCVLPIVIQNSVAIMVGGFLWKRFSSAKGALICLSGVTAFASCASMKRPDVQAVGEWASMGLLWVSVLAIT